VQGYECAPVVLMGYRRPEFTQLVFEQIRKAQPSELFLVMDGPKSGVAGEAELVAQTRQIAEKVDWPCAVHTIYSDQNLGLKKRVSSGLDQVFSRTERAIILEDDCLPSQDFFRYATELLDRYEDDERVGIISGASRLRGKKISEDSYHFSDDVRIWGFATWARTWNGFAQSGDLEAAWTQEQANLVSQKFPRGSRRRHIKSMLTSATNLDSWALPFAVHCVERGYHNPVSSVNLVRNIGFGASSTHTRFESFVKEMTLEPLAFPLQHPSDVESDSGFDAAEARRDRRQFLSYPLRHPLDTARRVIGYVVLILGSRKPQ